MAFGFLRYRLWAVLGLTGWSLWTFTAMAAAQQAGVAESLVPEGEALAPTLEAAAEVLTTVEPRQAIYALAWHPGGQEIATGDAGGLVTLWDLETGLEKRRLDADLPALRSLAFSSDGRWLAGVSRDGIGRLWDLATAAEPWPIENGWAVAFEPRGSRLAVGSRDGKIRILNPSTYGTELLEWQGHNAEISAIAWHPDGITVATGSWDRSVKIWDSSDGILLARMENDHGERVNAVDWSPDGEFLASAATDSTVRVWDFETSEELRRFDGHFTESTTVAWHPEGDILASGSRDATVRLWSLVSGGELARLEDFNGVVFSVGFNPSGSLLATGTQDGFVGIWAVASGKQVQQLGTEVLSVEALAFEDWGQSLAVGSRRMIRLWGGDRERPRAPTFIELEGDKELCCLALGGAGKKLAVGFRGGQVAWWQRDEDQARGYERQAPLQTDQSSVSALTFSSDVETLAVGFEDGSIRLWNLTSREEELMLEFPRAKDDPPPERSKTLAFSPDGSRLFGGFEGGAAYIWDIGSRRPSSLAYRELGEKLVASRFLSNNRVVVALRDGEVLVWDVARGTLREVAHIERRFKAAAFDAGGEDLAIVGSREALVRTVSVASPRAVGLSRVLFSGGSDHWFDCRPRGRCYRYDDGRLLLAANSSGELESVLPKRSAPAPELELAEQLPKVIELVDGEVAPVTVEVRNPGPQRAIWVDLRRVDVESPDAVVFYGPPRQVIVEPGQIVELQGRVSMHSAYENPITEEAELKLVVTSAGGKQLFLDPVRILNRVPDVEWRGARSFLGSGVVTFELVNTGGPSFSVDHVAIQASDQLSLIATDDLRDVSAGETVRFEWEIPTEVEGLSLEELELVAYGTDLPAHRWRFDKQRVKRFPFDRPWLNLLGLLMILAVAAYVRPRVEQWRRRSGARSQSGFHGWVGDPDAEYVSLAIVFTDIIRSTELLHDIRAAAWAAVRNQHFDHVNTLVEQFAGYVVKSVGDGCLIAFRSSIDALKFAVEIESHPGNEMIRLRVGVHVGQVQVDRDDAHGLAVNLAARVMDVAENGGVLVSNQVKVDYDSAFSGDDDSYVWQEVRDIEIPDFPRQGNLWSVQYRADARREPSSNEEI